MDRKRTRADGDKKHWQQVDFPVYHHEGLYCTKNQYGDGEQNLCAEFGEEYQCMQQKTKRTRRVCKPLVDLSAYESFCVFPEHRALLFHLSCALLDAQGQEAAAMADHLQLSVPDSAQVTGAAVCEKIVQDRGLVLQADYEPTSFQQKLMDCKLKIMASRLQYGADIWTLAAQIVNPYEIVPSVAIPVLNRAFFKMWELMQLFPDLVPPMAKKSKLLSAHLCEGPGGFVQAVHMYRKQGAKNEIDLRDGSPSSVIDYCPGQSGFGDVWFAITLAAPIGQGESLKMKMSRLQDCWSEAVQGHIHYGADQSGDITNPENINSFVQYVLQKSNGEKLHLITGDGAFDVSDDFSLQEQSHSHLFFCEILIAARLQCLGGNLVLKIFDCFTKSTVTLLRLLNFLYTTVDIVRLRTSRVCNSERFVVAQEFRLLPESVENKLMELSAAWYQLMRDGTSATINIAKPCPEPFRQALNQATTDIASNQILSILRAVNAAEHLGKKLSIIDPSQHKDILSILRRKLKDVKKLRVNAVSLCETLNIPMRNFKL